MVHSTGLLSPESRDGLSRTHCTHAAVSACTIRRIKFNPFSPINISLSIQLWVPEDGILNPIAELRTIMTYVVVGGGGGGPPLDDFGNENSKRYAPHVVTLHFLNLQR
jgi:hypothetical protein